MTKPLIREHNIETDEVVDREMTDAEFAQWQAAQAEQAAKDAELAAKESARQELLARLGITENEAALLLGVN